MNRAVLAFTLVILAAGLLAAALLSSRLTGRLSAPQAASQPEPLVPLDEIVEGGPPPDGIPPIDHPKFVSAADAEEFIESSTLGILVTVGSTTRFYPYNILTWHEVVNDDVGGRPLVITFCPLCATGFAFERRIGDAIYDFGTSGKLYQSNLVMYDRQTESLWSQVLMKAIVGPMTGTELALYPSSIVPFAKARAAIPSLQVLSTDTGFSRDYRHNPYQGYEESDEVYFPVSHVDDRLRPKNPVYVVSVDGRFKAYAFRDLLSMRALKDTLNGHPLDFRVSETDEIMVTDAVTGKRIVGFNAFWFSVVAVHPQIELWTSMK